MTRDWQFVVCYVALLWGGTALALFVLWKLT